MMSARSRNQNMTLFIMASMVLGVIFGLVTGRDFAVLDLIGQIFLRLIQMSIILLVMGQIIEAIGGIKPSEAGKIGGKTVAIFGISTLLAAGFGLVMALFFRPGSGIDIAEIDATAEVTAQDQSVYDTILGFFTPNVISSMANGVIVQVIVFAILFGLALSFVNHEGETALFRGLREFNQVIMRVIMIIMTLAPLGVFALVSSSIGKYGVEVILPLAKYLGTYGLATFLFLLLWIAVSSVYTRISPLALVNGVSRMSMLALATTSSAITLPTEMEDAHGRLGISKDVTQIVLPLGVSLNSNGAAMHMVVTIITIAQLYGVSYGMSDYLYIIVLASFASLANAVVPGAGLVSLSIVVPQMGLPLESIALFAGVEWFVGMLRTILNVDSDTFSALLVAKSEDKIDYSVFDTPARPVAA
jgi:Na+/H+-dicarboxylate symporter